MSEADLHQTEWIMAELVLRDVNDDLLRELQDRAAAHRRSPAQEAAAILSDVLSCSRANGWSEVDAIYNRLAASGSRFSDSTDLLREDRSR